MTYRAAIVGLDHYHVTGWAESLAHFGNLVEVVARYDPDPDRASLEAPQFIDPSLPARFPAWMGDMPFFSDLDALVEETRPDIAAVTLPNKFAPAAIDTLARHGVHLLVDKPGGRTAAELAPAVEIARESGIRLAVAFTRRYGRPWQDASVAIQGGRLGRLLTAEAIFVTSSVAVRDPENHIFSRELMGGGILHWLGVHDVDLLQWLAGEPIVEVQAMAGTVGGQPIEVEDAISIAFRFRGGTLGTMHFAYALPRRGGEGYVALRGSRASLRLDAFGGTTWIGPSDAGDPVLTQSSSVEMAPAVGYGSVGLRIIDDLLQAIEEGRNPLATGEHAVAALRVIDAAYASAATGEIVRVALDEGADP
jgi:predicted dehydrogenase